MSDITRIDTDGVRSILQVGQLAADNYADGDDVGRIWTGNGDRNRKLAFQDEILSGGSNSFEAKTYDELMNITPTDNTIYWYSESGKYVYGNTNSGTWNYFNDDKAISKAGSGTGDASTWIESWETENDADVHWDSSVFGSLQNGSESGKWNRHKNSTPSNSTGPSSASDGTWYLYTETSNNGHTTKFDLSTTNFAILKSIKFRYSMYGDDCGTLEFKTINSNGETTHYSVSGNQGQSWQEASIDLSDSGAEKIEFMYSGSKGWKADMALDKITIVSE